ncbi:MAG: hypothetical protein K9N23_12460 [Akkermansiaceae bacterium]|nr:hypothetical protein [Akkermansiaceae bacterium]
MERKSSQPAARRTGLRIATHCGMDPEVRAALAALESLARDGRVAVAGTFMPDPGVSARLAALGIHEQVEEPDFFRYRQVVIPYAGLSPTDRKRWSEAEIPLVDLSSAHVRRAQVALGLLRMEGAQPLVIGRHGDPETLALAATNPGTKIIQDTTDTARLLFSPAFGVVCQTTLSPRKVAWLLAQLRMRYRDATVTFLDTTAPSMKTRGQALEEMLDWCDAVVVVGQPGESTCEALTESADRRGRPAVVTPDADSFDPAALANARRVALTAGGFATDAAIRAVHQLLKNSSSTAPTRIPIA